MSKRSTYHMCYRLFLTLNAYAYDGDSEDSDNQNENLKLSKLLTSHLQRNQPPNQKAKILEISSRMHFLGPHKPHTFTLSQRRHLAIYFNIIIRNDDSVAPIGGTRWAGTVFHNTTTESFKVISKQMERSNSTRSSSYYSTFLMRWMYVPFVCFRFWGQ